MDADDRRASYYLHVGLPKTGTSYLQAQLRRHRQELQEHGVLYPRLGKRRRFLAALDGRDRHTYAGVHRSRAAGQWSKFADATRGFAGSVVFSHEVMGAPGDGEAPTALRVLEDHDVHIVLTVRDPARQLVSAWQQTLRHKSSVTFDEFVARSHLGERNRYGRRGFGNQHVDSVLRAWADHVPADHIHVVTVPPPGSPRDLLWARFCAVLGLDADLFPAHNDAPSNASLGIVQLEHLRRINAAVGNRITDRDRVAFVRRFLTDDVLGPTPSSPAPVLPPGARDVADELAERWIRAVKDGGYDVVGDLDDLRPSTAAGRTPADWDPEELNEVGARASAELLIAYTRLCRELTEVRAERARPQQPQRRLRRLRAAASRIRTRS